MEENEFPGLQIDARLLSTLSKIQIARILHTHLEMSFYLPHPPIAIHQTIPLYEAEAETSSSAAHSRTSPTPVHHGAQYAY
ncbi:hypothetical protein AWENTII_006745 [Aspergillus wentii]